MFTPEVTHVLLTIILVLAALIGVALVIALALAIKTIFEVFILIRAVRAEVSTVASAIRAAGEGLASKFGIVSAITGFFSDSKAKKTQRTKRSQE